MPMYLSFFRKWQYRFKTMVRYRLLFLTSAPIFLTLVALIGITIYWSIHYTWNSALIDVSERLGVANNSIELLQEKQTTNISSFSESYDFQIALKNRTSNTELIDLVSNQSSRYHLDFLTYHPLTNHNDGFRFDHITDETAFFDVISPDELNRLNSDLAERALVTKLGSKNQEARALVSRTIVPVKDERGQIMGFLDGGKLMNNSTHLVDQIRDLIYPFHDSELRPVGTLTLFLNNLRVSTNVPLNSHNPNAYIPDTTDTQQGRAIGTTVSSEVYQSVFVNGNEWVDKAFVYDAWYITAYQPIHDQSGQTIGMIYTGYLMWPFVEAYLTNIIEIGVTTLILLLISGVMVYRGSRDLFNPIEQIHRVVKLVQLGKKQRIGKLELDENHELAQLAKQFDNMLDLLETRKEEVKQAARNLEDKVQHRTASLEEKTAQLEHHISLLHQTRDKLVINEKLAALGELTAGIAHEINNPTAVILGNVELMQFELGNDASRVEEEVDAIMEQIDRIRNITRSLLQYSRQGGIQDEITWQHVNPIIEESITLVRTGSKKKGIQFITALNAHTPVEVNRHQLLQILVNLQMNAIHAMQGKGELTVTSEDWLESNQSIGAIIRVTDQGCGIKPESLKRIFDPFYTTKREGTGLGLSVSQSLLSQSGGEIIAESEVGKGSCFSIYLPKKADENLLIPTV